MKYMIIAGEASGDLHGSGLIKALMQRDEEAQFRFFGGDMMSRAAGTPPSLHYKEMNLMGFTEVVRKLPRIYSQLNLARNILDVYKPDAFIAIDYPSFNLKIARYAKKHGIPCYWYISPKVWAWKEFRVKQLRECVSKMLCILPFEPDFYRRHDYKEAIYVGNPTVEELAETMRRLPPLKHFIERQGLTGISGRNIIALLPGSRKNEIRRNLPLMIAAVKRFPEYKYVVAAADNIPERFYRETAQDPGLQIVFGATKVLVKYSQAAVVTSGTATLETALLETPQVVCYRANGNRLSYKIMEKLLKTKYVSLPNIIMNNSIVPELLLHKCTADSIAKELGPLLQNSPQRDWQLSGYKSLSRKLGTTIASEYSADLIIESLKR